MSALIDIAVYLLDGIESPRKSAILSEYLSGSKLDNSYKVVAKLFADTSDLFAGQVTLITLFAEICILNRGCRLMLRIQYL